MLICPQFTLIWAAYFINSMAVRIIVVLFLITSCTPALKEGANLLENLMKQRPEQFARILTAKDSLEVQIVYTQINRDENNHPSFRSFHFNVDSTRYFYPASTIKFPMSLLALEKLNELNMEGLDKYTPMFHDSVYSGQLSALQDSTSQNGLPSVAHYIKKILTVSDNDAHNRLYEFVGQKATNKILNQKGYSVRFLHRLDRPLTPDENRHTEAVRFVNDGNVIYQQPMLINTDSILPPGQVLKGIGYMANDNLINEPFDFTYKNFFSLTDQQRMLRAVLFPESIDVTYRFNLTEADYTFLYQYMSQLPTETIYPPYAKDTNYYDAYCKFFMFGEDHKPIPEHIRIFNKVGDAYGYLIDNAYIVDFKNNVEFMISAVINTNTDGIYNDGKYEYTTLGFPFFKNLGQLIYNYELKRKRKVKPNLSKFILQYDSPRLSKSATTP
jgi:hypothetical protein